MRRVKYALRWFAELRPTSGNTPWSLSGCDLAIFRVLQLKAFALKAIGFTYLFMNLDSFVTLQ